MGKKCVLVWGMVLVALVFVNTQVATAPQSSELPVLKTPDFSGLTTYPVVRVVDGDTIVVSEKDKDVNVRLVGVDTPETAVYYAKEASLFTTNLLKGEKVYLIGEPLPGALDRYGRTLAYVYRAPDGLFVNAEIIRQGYGHAYIKFPFKYKEEFKQLEQFAKEAEKGLWATSPQAKEKTVSQAIAPPVAKPKQPDVEDVTVYVTKTGTKYHRGNCSYLRQSKIPMKLKDAKARGYTPCSRCNPPR